MTTRIFMILCARPGQMEQPQSRSVGVSVGIYDIEHIFGDTDIGDDNLP